MINNWLRPHIYKIHNLPNYAIAIDLFFKHDFKFCIISVYLPCDDTQLRLTVQNTVISWLQQAMTSSLQLIILEDFNVSDNILHSSSIKYKLLHFLQHNNIYDLASHTQSLTNTWQSSRF